MDEFMNGALDMDVVYNIGDAINKIGFGLVIYLWPSRTRADPSDI